MKKALFLTVGVSWLLVGAAIPVSAQPVRLKGEVPFAFVSGERTLQAGEYSIEITQGRVRFFDANGHQAQSIFPNPQQESGTEEQPRLVFHQYGDTYILWQIWTRDHKVDFRMSRTEYKLKTSLKGDQGTIILSMR